MCPDHSWRSKLLTMVWRMHTCSNVCGSLHLHYVGTLYFFVLEDTTTRLNVISNHLSIYVPPPRCSRGIPA